MKAANLSLLAILLLSSIECLYLRFNRMQDGAFSHISEYRKIVKEHNVDAMKYHLSGNHHLTFKMKPNEFIYLTPEEFKAHYANEHFIDEESHKRNHHNFWEMFGWHDNDWADDQESEADEDNGITSYIESFFGDWFSNNESQEPDEKVKEEPINDWHDWEVYDGEEHASQWDWNWNAWKDVDAKDAEWNEDLHDWQNDCPFVQPEHLEPEPVKPEPVKPEPTKPNTKPYPVEPTKPDHTHFDWRKTGKVSSVKNQGECGSCWAHAIASLVESAYLIHKDTTLDLSEQQMVDCDETNFGCSGGVQEWGLEYVKKHGITTEAKYPYIRRQNRKCKKSAGEFKISQFLSTSRDCKGIVEALKDVGPVAVGVATDNHYWTFYSSGIMNVCVDEVINHAVVMVGITPQYYIIKNSWGTAWGIDGYVHLDRKLKDGNLCGVCTEGHVVSKI